MTKRLSGLFEQIAEPTTLTLAFAHVRENAGGPGGDGISIDAFARRLANEVTALTYELLSGSYQPRRARPAQMPKKSGGFRKLMIPAVRDRVIQTAASTLLVAGLDREMEDVSFGYRPGRSVQQAVRMVDKHRRDVSAGRSTPTSAPISTTCRMTASSQSCGRMSMMADSST